MKGLIFKDIRVALKTCRTFIVLALIFSVVLVFDDAGGNMFLTVYPCVLAGMMPVTLLSQDERCGWNAYLSTLPCSAAEIVSSKYVITLMFAVIAIALNSTGSAIRLVRMALPIWPDLLPLMGIMAVLALVSPALMLPMVFRFGTERGRILSYITFGAACAIGVGAKNTPKFGTLAGEGTVAAIGIAAAALIFALSWLLSIRLYKKREH